MAASESASTRPSSVDPVDLTAIAAVLGTRLDASSVRETTAEVSVTGLSLNSNAIHPGDLYAALPGARTHGARYANDAVARGAVAIVTDAGGREHCAGTGVPVLVADSPRSVLGELAAFIYGRPAEALMLVGVTGTQGKTTTTQLISRAAAAAGATTAVVGTMGTWIDGEPVGSALTTPEAPDLHALFAVMRERGVGLCAIEVSSHALVMGRVDGVVFDLAVFTNLGRDHLDFHSDMEDYFAAKAELFTPARARRGLVNIDDEYGERLAATAPIPLQTMSVSGKPADWNAVMDVGRSDPGSTAFDISGPNGESAQTAVPMPGGFNVANGLAAFAVCVEAGIDAGKVAKAMVVAQPVGGRMERIVAAGGVSVIVDYAHKPDALSAALNALRPVTPGRLILVIGAGGDRDRGKRPIMGEVGARLADMLVITDDNPRSEDPAVIRAEVLAGAGEVETGAHVVEVGDRRAAIRFAIGEARDGDAVLIAGKGHETGQEIEGSVYPFDDREEALKALQAMSSAPTTGESHELGRGVVE